MCPFRLHHNFGIILYTNTAIYILLYIQYNAIHSVLSKYIKY